MSTVLETLRTSSTLQETSLTFSREDKGKSRDFPEICGIRVHAPCVSLLRVGQRVAL